MTDEDFVIREDHNGPLAPAWEPVPMFKPPEYFTCTGCGTEEALENLTSRFGKPQLVGEVKGKRLIEARCAVCDSHPHKGLQAVWKEQ